jgi:cyclopropane fatty-acyl-phospholipid synthase-like methyltransferase
MSKKKSKILSSIINRFLNPKHLYNVIKLQRNRKKTERVYDDAQLKLYHKIMPGDFLHYGYFADANIKAGEISLHQFYRAQLQYAENLLQHVTDTQNEILDVGCGMGGLLKLMNEKKWKAIGVTPDVNQAKYIRETYPNKIHECRFEDMPTIGYEKHFGTIITSESLQYLQLDDALPIIESTLKVGGKWIACDYFKIGEASEKSGHNYNLFLDKLKTNGFTITHQQDITPHILPTIAFVHLWATQVVQPLLTFGEEKMKVKAPGIHYAMQEALPEINAKIQKNIDVVDPIIFAKQKQYLLMVIERI